MPTSYVWGGASLSGMDCSGLVSYVYQHAAGITLP
ncbi:NlpC/P60 family protein [Lactiplantibacillus plantarum]|nr:NlpC/P60 family protein [Lactiplantibacillus plantarum]